MHQNIIMEHTDSMNKYLKNKRTLQGHSCGEKWYREAEIIVVKMIRLKQRKKWRQINDL